MTEALIAHCTAELDRMNRFALDVPAIDPRREETIQYWLGRRDAYASLIRHLKAPTVNLQDVPA